MANNEDIKITVVADTSDAVDGFKDMEKASDKATKSMVKDGKDIQKSLDGVEKSAKDIQSAFKNIDMKSLTSGLKSFYKEAKNVAVNVGKQLKDALNVKGSVDAKVNMTTDTSSGASSSSDSMMGSMMSGGAMGSQIAKQLAQMQPTMEKVKSSFKDLPQQLQSDMGKAIEGVTSAIQTVFNMEKNLKDVGIEIDMSDYINLDNLDETFENLMNDWKGKIKYFEEQLEILPKNIELAQQKLKENPNQQEGISKYIDTLQDKLKLVQTHIDKYKNELNSISTVKFSLGLEEELAKLDKLFEIYEAKPLKINAQPIIDEFERIREQMKSLGVDTSFMDAMFDEWNYICQNGTKATAQLGSAMRNVRTDMGTLQQGTQQLINTQTLEIRKQRELASVSKDSSKAYQTLQKALIQAKYGFKQFGSDLKSLFSAMKKNSKVLDETAKKAKKLGQETKQASKQIKSATTGIAASFKGMLASVLPFLSIFTIFNTLKSSTVEAMEAIETSNMYMAVFGDKASEMDAWINEVNKSMGLGVSNTKQYTAIIQQMGSAMGLTTEEAMDMSKSMATMAGDISSFYNVDIAQAQEDLRSALSGSNEVLTKYGIVLREDTIKQYAYANGIARVNSELTASQRAMALTMMVEQQLGQANGDMARTMDSPANRARRLSTSLGELKVALGNVVLPIWNAVMPGLIALANALTSIFNTIARVINGILSLFGMGLSTGGSGGGGFVQDVQDIGTSLGDGLSDAGGGAGDVADSLADGSKSAKEIKKYLSGLDELNLTPETSDSGSSGGSGSGGSGGAGGGGLGDLGGLSDSLQQANTEASVFMNEIPEWIKRMSEIFTKAFNETFNYQMFDEFLSNCKRVQQALCDIFGNQELQIATQELNDTLIAELGSLVGMVGTLAFSIGNAIVGGIADSLEDNKEYIIQKMIGITNIEKEASEIRQNLYKALSDIFSTLGGEEAKGIVNNVFTTLTVGLLEGQELFSKLGRDVVLIMADAIIKNKGKIKKALKGALSFGNDITGTIKDVLTNAFSHVNDVYDEKVKPAVDRISACFTELWGVLLDGWNKYVQPVLDSIADKFDEVMKGNVGSAITHVIDLFGNIIEFITVLWQEHLQPIAVFLIEILAPAFAGAFDIICTVVLDFIDVVAGIFDGFVQVFNGVIEFITGLFSGDLEKALDGLGKIWDGLVKIVETIWDSIWDNTKEIWDKIKEHLVKIWEQVNESIGKFLKQLWDDIVERFTKMKEIAIEKWEQLKTGLKNKCSEIWTAVKTKWNEIKEGLKTKCSEIKEGLKTKWEEIKTAVTDKIDKLKTDAIDKVTDIKDGIVDVFNKLVQPIKDVFNDIWDAIEPLIEDLKNAFDFDWTLPSIKLPKVSITKKTGLFGLEYPSFSVSWNAKGGIFDSPTIFDTNRGLQGVGEAGAEAIIPISNLWNELGKQFDKQNQILANKGSNGGNVTITLAVDGKELARATTKGMSDLARIGALNMDFL